MSKLRPQRDTVLVSLMEHHSNDLPHRHCHARTLSVPCRGAGSALGELDLSALRELLAAHQPLRMCRGGDDDIDALVFSGHKVYAPGSPGVLVMRKHLLESCNPQEFGGGMVERVSVHQFQALESLPDREEAGTPNIGGSFLLAAALKTLMRIGMDRIHERELSLGNRLLDILLAATAKLKPDRTFGAVLSRVACELIALTHRITVRHAPLCRANS